MKEVSLPSTRRPTIQFGEKDRITGMAGVNRYSVEGTVSGKDSISWAGPAAVTKMAGPPEAMALEDAFLQALQAVTRIEQQGGKLKLATTDGATRLEFVR